MLRKLFIGNTVNNASLFPDEASIVQKKILPLIQHAGALKDKCVLDVYPGNCLTTRLLIQLGADAYALHPSSELLDKAVEAGYLPENKALAGTLNELVSTSKEKFDVIFVSACQLLPRERGSFFLTLSELCKETGAVIIGTNDADLVFNQDNNRDITETFRHHAEANFGCIKLTDSGVAGDNQYVLICTLPALDKVYRLHI